ncbi:conjugal transfer protein [Streptomyces sp. NPDC059445]|uniref:conjugal transfer protein n=1 Tax=Streptomyces sp. NPDC059445 TaxID=3346832 RepID=UPI0036C01576
MSPDRQALQSEAAVPVAGGGRLEVMRRRVRLSQLTVWAVIATGPVALALAATSTPTAVEATIPARPTAVRTAAAADPAGYAQLFVSAWLRSSADDATTAQARLAQSMASDVELPDPGAGAQSEPESVTALRSAQGEGGVWSVTVAAQYADGSVRYYAVRVAADRSGFSFAVTGVPGVVAGPGRADVPRSPYGVPVAKDGLSSAVGEFLAAYLTGAGEVDRYLAPNVALSPVSPAPFTGVAVEQVLAVEGVAAVEKRPSDGTTTHVLARVEARDNGGRWPLAYELTLRARSGRWEVAALKSGAGQEGGTR